LEGIANQIKNDEMPLAFIKYCIAMQSFTGAKKNRHRLD
jgi:hypothetical protein